MVDTLERTDEVVLLRAQAATLQQLLEVLERTALDQARKLERAAERNRYLADASAVLISTLDVARTLERVAYMALPAFADWSFVHLRSEDGALRRMAVAHADPALAARIRAIEQTYPPTGDEPYGPARVARTSEPELVESINEALLDALAQNADHFEQLRSFGFTSYVSVPLRGRTQTLGAISFAMAESKRRYTSDDLLLAQQLADRAALALENARLFAQVEEARRTLERRVRERTRELEEANRELESFSYSVSHDLRAPIRHIGGFTDLLMKRLGPDIDDVAARYVRVIAEGAQNAGRLVDDLLAFSRMGRADMVHAHVSMDALVAQARAELAPEVGDRAIEWRIGTLGEVTGDESMLRLVWRNLMANAIKYTRTREMATIELGREDAAAEVRFFIRDNGVGFDMRYVHKLFGVFQRLHRPEDYEGTGIGLANVRRIVTRHGGRTWAEAERDKGATFWFALPAEPAETRDE